MKRKKLIVLLASIGFILVLVLSGCAPTAEPEVIEKIVKETVTIEVDKTYKVVTPLSEDMPHELAPLNPRIDTLEGKHIAFAFAEGSPVVMPALWERLQKAFPTTTWVYSETRSTGPERFTEEQLVGVDALIVGNAW